MGFKKRTTGDQEHEREKRTAAFMRIDEMRTLEGMLTRMGLHIIELDGMIPHAEDIGERKRLETMRRTTEYWMRGLRAVMGA